MGIIGSIKRKLCLLSFNEALLMIAGIFITLFLANVFVSKAKKPTPHYIKYDITSPNNNQYECPDLELPPIHLKVCIHPDDIDKDISYYVHYEGSYRRFELASFYRVVRRERDYGLIDIGAHIGLHSLIANTCGRPVLAVEPVAENVLHFHRSLQIQGRKNTVKVLMNAVSDRIGPAYLIWEQGHIGYAKLLPSNKKCKGENCAKTHLLRMNDLLPYINFKKAFLKVSASGEEARIFLKSDKIFKQIFIALIFMDFQEGLRICRGVVNGILSPNDPDAESLGEALKFLHSMDYIPHHGGNGEFLEPTRCQTWPDTMVIWKHPKFTGSFM